MREYIIYVLVIIVVAIIGCTLEYFNSEFMIFIYRVFTLVYISRKLTKWIDGLECAE